MKSTLKRHLSPEARQRLRKLLRRPAYFVESLAFGGRLRESILIGLLRAHYASLFRRQWELSDEVPHFFSHRMSLFEFAFGEEVRGPYSYYSAFFSSEVLQNGDRLLDIGCGDGFFTNRFFRERCAHIDAVDIEPSAIEVARINNSAPNITYHLLDAVNQPFPSDEYDVVVWDGALGHFSADTTHHMLQKIQQQLAPDGIFVGSESLGIEGADHLQFFNSLDDFYLLFKLYFKHRTSLRELQHREEWRLLKTGRILALL